MLGVARVTLSSVAVAVVLAACGPGDDAAPGPDTGDEPSAGSSDDGVATDATDDEDEDTHAPASGSEEVTLSVVATVAPITDLVASVGGERVEASSLVPAGADSHTYEPRPRDVADLAGSDAYFGIGLDLNPGAVRLAEENLPADAPVILLGEVAFSDDALVFDHSHDEDGGHSHGDDGGHSHDDDGGHSHDDDRGELGPNPHVWTSLRNAAGLVEAIADALSELDPDGEVTYRDNAAVLQEEFDELDRRIGDATATIPAANRTLVTYHDAWTYFARDYRLDLVTAVQPTDFSEPSAAEVRSVIDLIRERDVVAVFGSEVFPTPVLEAIAEETDAVYIGDLADDVLPGEPGDPEHRYAELMRRNAVLIVDALGGDTSQLDS